jgi:hypothetical protein
MHQDSTRLQEGDIEMARQTKLKFAAIATVLLATLGVAGTSVATTSDAGHGVHHSTSLRGGDNSWCC